MIINSGKRIKEGQAADKIDIIDCNSESNINTENVSGLDRRNNEHSNGKKSST